MYEVFQHASEKYSMNVHRYVWDQWPRLGQHPKDNLFNMRKGLLWSDRRTLRIIQFCCLASLIRWLLSVNDICVYAICQMFLAKFYWLRNGRKRECSSLTHSIPDNPHSRPIFVRRFFSATNFLSHVITFLRAFETISSNLEESSTNIRES